MTSAPIAAPISTSCRVSRQVLHQPARSREHAPGTSARRHDPDPGTLKPHTGRHAEARSPAVDLLAVPSDQRTSRHVGAAAGVKRLSPTRPHPGPAFVIGRASRRRRQQSRFARQARRRACPPSCRRCIGTRRPELDGLELRYRVNPVAWSHSAQLCRLPLCRPRRSLAQTAPFRAEQEPRGRGGSRGGGATLGPARYGGVCRGCGAYTQPRNGKGDAYAYSEACHPGAIERRWTRGRVIDAMCEWRSRYGRLPTSYDWSRTHARRRGREALERLGAGEWPPASVVGRLFGSWAVARRAASGAHVDAPQIAAPEPVELIGHTRDLCTQSPLIARKIRDYEGRAEQRQFCNSAILAICRTFTRSARGCARYSGR